MDRDHLDEGIQRGRQALGMYQVVDNAAWQTQRVVCNLSAENAQRLRTELGDLMLLVSRGLLTRAAAAPTVAPSRCGSFFSVASKAASASLAMPRSSSIAP